MSLAVAILGRSFVAQPAATSRPSHRKSVWGIVWNSAAKRIQLMPTLYIFSGLPGAGKTTLAKQLANQVGAFYLRIDTVE